MHSFGPALNVELIYGKCEHACVTAAGVNGIPSILHNYYIILFVDWWTGSTAIMTVDSRLSSAVDCSSVHQSTVHPAVYSLPQSTAVHW